MTQTPLEKVLAARESIHAIKHALIQQYKLPVVSMALNIAGWPKTDRQKRKFFFHTLNKLHEHLYANRLPVSPQTAKIIDNDNGLTFIACINAPEDSAQIKIISERFEANQVLGRFIDVDVIDESGEIVSSEKQKVCFFCGQYPAIDCMRNQRHTTEELRKFQQNKIQDFLIGNHRKNQSHKLTELTIYALFTEASLHPKPGLVSPFDNGAHNDMDYNTFSRSISALSPIFNQFYLKCLDPNQNLTIEDMRIWGIQAEKKMNAATEGINTHKGAIFLMLLVGKIITDIIKTNESISIQAIKNGLKNYNKHIENDKAQVYEQTHGNIVQKAFPQLKAGIRQQVMDGLPAVFQGGIIPMYTRHFSPQQKIEELSATLKISLLSIMEQNIDSNIIHRGGPELLKILKQKAKESKVALLEKQNHTYNEFCKWTKNKNLSPGGSADLLALTIFIYLCTINPLLKPYEF